MKTVKEYLDEQICHIATAVLAPLKLGFEFSDEELVNEGNQCISNLESAVESNGQKLVVSDGITHDHIRQMHEKAKQITWTDLQSVTEFFKLYCEYTGQVEDYKGVFW